MTQRRILSVLLGLACLTGFSVAACSDDDSGGKDQDESPSTGDGDGDTDGADDEDGIVIPGVDAGGDGDGDGDAQCTDGEMQECTCADGTSKGQQYCLGGEFQGACLNCPCMDGDSELCLCEGGGTGQHVCEGTEWAECECLAGDGGVAGPCPSPLTCQDLMGIAMGGACVDPNAESPVPGFNLPTECTDVAQCQAAGYDAAICTKIMYISDALGGAKFCVQQCTPGGDTPADAGTP